jgi:hypothetical protein
MIFYMFNFGIKNIQYSLYISLKSLSESAFLQQFTYYFLRNLELK